MTVPVAVSVTVLGDSESGSVCDSDSDDCVALHSHIVCAP